MLSDPAQKTLGKALIIVVFRHYHRINSGYLPDSLWSYQCLDAIYAATLAWEPNNPAMINHPCQLLITMMLVPIAIWTFLICVYLRSLFYIWRILSHFQSKSHRDAILYMQFPMSSKPIAMLCHDSWEIWKWRWWIAIFDLPCFVYLLPFLVFASGWPSCTCNSTSDYEHKAFHHKEATLMRHPTRQSWLQ